MQSIRPLVLITVCLYTVVLLTSCGGHTESVRKATLTSQATPTVSASSPMPIAVPEQMCRVRVPILMYHHIGWLNPTAGKEWYVTTVTPMAFEQQMAYLARNGYRAIKISDLIVACAGHKRLPKKPVVITFDDGWIEVYERAFPVLQKYGMTATFFLNTGAIGAAEASTMNWAQVLEMSKAGMEIGSHSMSHQDLTKLAPDILAWELKNSKAMIEQHIGKTVEVFAYPFGLYDSNLLRQTQAAGYRAAVTVADGLFDTSANWFEMPRQNVSYSSDLNAFSSLLCEKSPHSLPSVNQQSGYGS